MYSHMDGSSIKLKNQSSTMVFQTLDCYREILKIKRKLFVERCADRAVGSGEQQGISIRSRLDHRLDSQISAHSRAVLDHNLLTELSR